MSEEMEKDNLGEQAEDITQPPEENSGQSWQDAMVDFDLEDYMSAYKQLLAEKEALMAEKGDLDARLLRLQADFDNYRRRQRESNEETIRQAASSLVAQLLPVVDNLERALGAMSDSQDKLGVEMIYRHFMQLLQGAGLEEVPALGEMFDPNLHQAVTQSEAAAEDKGRVLCVLQKGYTMNGRLLRAAMVQVGC